MARPQVGIERLPTATPRRIGSEQRESMNCKSCRKRKIKCNRLRPTCEACKIFQCACLYDAVPKKRGPKTDVLEALLKRVDGLEKRLVDDKKPTSPTADSTSPPASQARASPSMTTSPKLDTSINGAPPVFSPFSQSPPTPTDLGDVLIDTYFGRVHEKPFHILDEDTIRRQHRLNELPTCLRLAIYSVSTRFAGLTSNYAAALRMGEDYALQARVQIDTDEPSIEGLQSLLLIHHSFLAAGMGRKAYMLLTSAISMCVALDLHRELPAKAKTSFSEREFRRQLFWTCYLMDRFTATGSKRPSFISNDSMILRLPSWVPHLGALPIEGEYFSVQSNFQNTPGCNRLNQGSLGMLIDIARILGMTNRYLANGGVKGDSHFPWHSLSTLSKLRQDLDFWASGNQDIFTDMNMVMSQPDSVIIVLSKFVFHVIHCLIYRPFLPVDLAELRGTGQHQSWQIEATNLCFLHANAIAELATLTSQFPSIEWPAFVGYCICTAGTVHVHGVHYKGQDGEIYSLSGEYLGREMHILSELRYTWACVQHQKDTLQNIYLCHSDLVKSLVSNPLRFSPVFHLEDFFDRYPGQYFDGAHVTFIDMVVENMNESLIEYDHGRSHQGVDSYLDGGNNDPMAQQALPLVSPSIPHVSQQRRYTDSAVSISTIVSNDKHLQSDNTLSPQLSNLPEFDSFHSAGLQPPSHEHPTGFSPSFSFSPLPQSTFDPALFALPPGSTSDPNSNANGNIATYAFDPSVHTQPVVTPGAASHSESSHANEEKDPFLTLLEQLAENEHSRRGPSDLDYYLGAQEG